MKKKFTLLLAATLTVFIAFSQSISPDENTEFCPLTDITFTVTLPRIAANTQPNVASWTGIPQIVSGASNITNTSTQTTFTFVGRFRDENVLQTFKIDYTPNGGTSTSYYPVFKKIKSLSHGNTVSQSCLPISPNQTLLTAAPCQAVNLAISFNNIQWSTFGENPAFSSPLLVSGRWLEV